MAEAATGLQFVLVHGSWHTGAGWRHVSGHLTAAGHRVLAPILAGRGEGAATGISMMDMVDGRIFWDAAIPEVDNDARTAMYTEMNRVLAALHWSRRPALTPLPSLITTIGQRTPIPTLPITISRSTSTSWPAARSL